MLSRRAFIVRILCGGLVSAPGLSRLARTAHAMGSASYPQGMQKIQGDVRINGIPADVGAAVGAGDVVTTGTDGFAVFVIGKSVYLLRENTRLDLEGDTSEKYRESAIRVLRMLGGKMLSVTREKEKQIISATAVIGVRGSGIYVEAEPERTYVCLCYGIADIEARADAGATETVQTKHHEAPRYVYAAGSSRLIEKAPMKNHTDQELVMLEKMVGRRPPFAGSGLYS